MDEQVTKFIADFHNVPGETVKRKQENIFTLFRQHSSLAENPIVLNSIFANLKAENHLERIFLIDCLIHFQRFDELYRLVTAGDEIAAKKVLKREWFLQKALNEVTPADFVNNILPTLSYSIKAKILKKLPFNEAQADETFDLIRQKYGILLATVVLPKCTTQKIEQVLNNHPVKFTQSQMKAVFEKDSNLIALYVEERIKFEGKPNFLNHSSIVKYLAQKDPQLFSRLYSKHKFETSLGRRTTKHFIAKEKAEVIDKSKYYVSILNHSALVRMLGPELKDIFFKPCKGRWDASLGWWFLLKHYPQKIRFEVFQSAYNSFYYDKFGENIDDISIEMLKEISNAEQRQRLALMKLNNDTDDYLKYATSQYCLKEFFKRVNHMSCGDRANFVELTMECCFLNKDSEALLKVFELVSVRFKNDEQRVRDSFFLSLNNDNSNYRLLKEEHWNHVVEILAVANAKDNWVHNQDKIRAEYLTFLVENGYPLEEPLSKYNKWSWMVSDLNKTPKVFKAVAMALLETGPTKSNDEMEDARNDCLLATAVKIHNSRHPKNSIPIHGHPRIMKSLEYILSHESGDYVDTRYLPGIGYLICQSTTSKALKKLYFQAFKSFGEECGLLWFLQHEPKTLQENFSDLLNRFLEKFDFKPDKFWLQLKKYPDSEITKTVIDYCKAKLKEQGCQHKKKLVKILATLSPPDSYIELVDTMSSVKGLLIKFLHLTGSHSKILPVVLECCKSNFLQPALVPLYSCFCKLPENDTRIFINKLKESNGLSIKKHVVWISCMIYDLETAYECLKNAQRVPLKAAIKFFVKNPSESSWQLVESKIRETKKNELQELKWAVTVTIPRKYKSQYMETIWKVLEKYENTELKKEFFKNIDKECLLDFDKAIVSRIIRDHVFQLEEADDFLALFVIYSDDEKKFALFTSMLQDFKENLWNRPESQRIVRQKLNKFIHTLFKTYMEGKEVDKNCVSQLSVIFKSVFSFSEAFEENIIIRCMDFKNETPEYCARILIDLNNALVPIYNNYAVTLVADVVKILFKHVLKTDEEQVELCYSLLKQKQSVPDCLLIVALLPKQEPRDIEHFSSYKSIFKELGQGVGDVVQLQLTMYLKLDYNCCPDVNLNEYCVCDN